jgi:hypothetical protein
VVVRYDGRRFHLISRTEPKIWVSFGPFVRWSDQNSDRTPLCAAARLALPSHEVRQMGVFRWENRVAQIQAR